MRFLKHSVLLSIAMLLTSLGAKAQLKAIVYVDLSDQGNRSALIAKVDSVLNATKGEKLLYISNAATPLVFQDANLGSKESSAISTLDPSLPNPYFDLDSLVKLSHAYGGFDEDLQVNFFISLQQAVKGEKHLNNIAEKYLMSLGLAKTKGAHKNHASAFLNSSGEMPSGSEIEDLKNKHAQVYQLKVY